LCRKAASLVSVEQVLEHSASTWDTVSILCTNCYTHNAHIGYHQLQPESDRNISIAAHWVKSIY